MRADVIRETVRRMPDVAVDTSVSPSARRRNSDGIFSDLLAGAVLVGGAAAGAVAVRLLLPAGGFVTDCFVELPPVLVAGLVAWRLVCGYQRRWVRPTQQLQRLLTEIRAGSAPIEELANVGGAAGPLAEAVGEILRELRKQKASVAELEAEIRQRVAHRTSALERTIASLRQQATRDALTGLYNRRMLDEHLPKVVEHTLAEGADLCVLMIDIDHFKSLNDTLGHAAGDVLLKTVGELIRSAIRGGDAAFRCGGDEFLILLPGCGRGEAQSLAGRLTSLVDSLSKSFRVEDKPRLSIGICCLSELASRTPANLLREADAALYEVKAAHHDASRKSRDPLQPRVCLLQSPTSENSRS